MLSLIIAASCSAALTLVLKIFRDPKGNRFGIILGNYLTCVLLAFVQMPEKGRIFDLHPSTLIMSGIGGFLYVSGLVFTQTSVQRNGATLTSAFSKLGLIVPLFISFLFFDEIPSLLKICGVLLAIAAILLMNYPSKTEKGEEKTPAKEKSSLVILLLTLFACGCSESMAKIFARLGDQREDTRYFFFLFLTAALLTFVLSVVETRKNGKTLRAAELGAGVLAGIPNYFSSYFLLQALLDLPAALVYPVFSVGSILLVAGGGMLFFRERLSRIQCMGFVLILGALVLLNL